MSTTIQTTTRLSSASASFMLPGMSSPSISSSPLPPTIPLPPLSPSASASSTTTSSSSRVVRFETECVLIPEIVAASPSKLPIQVVLSKQYALPLWTKKRAPASGYVEGQEDGADGGEGGATGNGNGRERVVLRVPIPLFRRRSSSTSRSPTRFRTSPSSSSGPGHGRRSASTSPVMPKTLPSCLVHRPPPGSYSSAISSFGSPLLTAGASPSSSPFSSNSPGAGAPIPPRTGNNTLNIPLTPVRRPSLPTYPSAALATLASTSTSTPKHTSSSPSAHAHHPGHTTVPLRPCCEACEAATDGAALPERFTRGARRRRSASLDRGDYFVAAGFSASAAGHVFGGLHAHAGAATGGGKRERDEFRGLAAALDDIVYGDEAGDGDGDDDVDGDEDLAKLGGTSAFALRVDEVDQKRRSIEMGIDEGRLGLGLGFATSSSSSSKRHRQRDSSSSSAVSTSSTSTSTSTASSSLLSTTPPSPHLLDALDARYRLRASPIAEEDEAQLFPLPRRSPASSNAGSRSATPSPRVSPVGTPVGTPNGSVTFLGVSGGVGAEKGPGGIGNGSQESLLKASLSRRASPSASPILISTSSAVVSSLAPATSATPTPATSTPAISAPTTTVPAPSTQRPPTSRRTSAHGLQVATAPSPEERASAKAMAGAAGPMSPRGPRAPVKDREGRATMVGSSSSSKEISNANANLVSTPLPPVAAMPVPETPANGAGEAAHQNHSHFHLPSFHVHGHAHVNAHAHAHTRSTSSGDASSTLYADGTTTTNGTTIANANTNAYSTSNTHAYTPSHTPSHTHTHTRSTSGSASSGTGEHGGNITHAGNIPGSPQRRKLSFTAPFIKAGEALRDVSADVLKGVSSMSGAGVGV